MQHGTLINTLIMRKSALILPSIIKYRLSLLLTRIIISRKRLVFRHLINLIRRGIFISCRLINLFLVVFRVDLWLIAILQPIVEIVSKLFQEVHITSLTILFITAYVLPSPRRHILLLFTIHKFRYRLDFVVQTIQHIVQANF